MFCLGEGVFALVEINRKKNTFIRSYNFIFQTLNQVNLKVVLNKTTTKIRLPVVILFDTLSRRSAYRMLDKTSSMV